MTYEEIWKKAAENLDGSKCRACGVCNGAACRGVIPGPGAVGTGSSFTHSWQALRRLKLNVDPIYEAKTPDPGLTLFGRRLAAPVLCAPIGGVAGSFGPYYQDEAYTMDLLKGCLEGGTLAFTGDAPDPSVYTAPMKAVRTYKNGIPTFKPRTLEDAARRIALAEENGAVAIGMDIDTVGLPGLRKLEPPVRAQSAAQLGEMIALTKLPVVVKGVLSPRCAEKALAAGAAAIVVSAHGGRVMDDLPAPAQVLPAIRKAVGRDAVILADGGVRTGVDVFKLLALGADAALVGRPYVVATYGGGSEGARVLTEKLKGELVNAMYMTGAGTLEEITDEMVFE